MNFPCRSMALIFCPASARAVSTGRPRRMRSWPNSAFSIRRPTISGRRVRTTVSTSGNSGNIHQNVGAFDADGIDGNGYALIENAGSGGRTELPHVPGAGDGVAVEYAFAQWTALMRAGAGKRAHFAVYIAEGIYAGFIFHLDERSG